MKTQITFEDCIANKYTFKELVDYEVSRITFWSWIKYKFQLK